MSQFIIDERSKYVRMQRAKGKNLNLVTKRGSRGNLSDEYLITERVKKAYLTSLFKISLMVYLW